MKWTEEQEEEAFFDYLEARERMLDAAAGYFCISNIPTTSLRIIAATTTNEVARLAAEVVIWQRENKLSKKQESPLD